MPIYQYKCKKCGEITEKLQKVTDKPIKKCEHCGAEVEKIISAPGIIFKGSGFHITDYKRGKTSPTKEEKPKEGKTDAKVEKKKK